MIRPRPAGALALLIVLTLPAHAAAAPQCSGGYNDPPAPEPNIGPGDSVPPGGTPRPAAPGAPASTPAATTPAPASSGAPSGSGPAGLTPNLPRTPFKATTLEDSSAWQLWWRFNRDPYLGLKEAVYAGGARTTGADFSLGQPVTEPEAGASLRPPAAMIAERVAPALARVAREAGDEELRRQALLALARIGSDNAGQVDLPALLRSELMAGRQRSAETAVVGLGVAADTHSAQLLANLLRDDAAGRKLCGRSEVPTRMRAFAAYALGLCGQHTGNAEVRRFAVHQLCQNLGRERGRKDVDAACALALGLVPLDPRRVAADDPRDLPPTTSRGAQLGHLLEIFRDRNQPLMVRAHLPRALARLQNGASDARREEIARALLRGMDERSKEPNQIQRSCVLALGALGDADADALDRDIRKALMQAHTAGGQEVRRFAAIALAQVAGRPGAGEGHPLEGTADIRSFLMQQMARGSRPLRPWVGMALGLMARNLHENRQLNSRDGSRALTAQLAHSKVPYEVGAYCIGAGLSADPEPVKELLRALERFQDDEVRAHACLALGMSGAVEAIEPLEQILEDSWHRPELMREAATALALLGDKSVVPTLVDMLGRAGCNTERFGITGALGAVGDRRAVDALIVMLEDADLQAGSRAFAAQALGMVADKDDLPWQSRISVDLNYIETPTTLTSQTREGILDAF